MIISFSHKVKIKYSSISFKKTKQYTIEPLNKGLRDKGLRNKDLRKQNQTDPTVKNIAG